MFLSQNFNKESINIHEAEFNKSPLNSKYKSNYKQVCNFKQVQHLDE